MAQQRSRRLRKKMRIDEFQEIGFMVYWDFPSTASVEEIDSALDKFVDEVFKTHHLSFDGYGHHHWEGLVCQQKIGKCTEAHRGLVANWLEDKGMLNVRVGHLIDINYLNEFE